MYVGNLNENWYHDQSKSEGSIEFFTHCKNQMVDQTLISFAHLEKMLWISNAFLVSHFYIEWHNSKPSEKESLPDFQKKVKKSFPKMNSCNRVLELLQSFILIKTLQNGNQALSNIIWQVVAWDCIDAAKIFCFNIKVEKGLELLMHWFKEHAAKQ